MGSSEHNRGNISSLGHQMVICYNIIDFKKAFDRVRHSALWMVMRNSGISVDIVDVIKSLYEESRSHVQIGDITSDRFQPTVGVRQGCLLSPQLFNIFLEHIMTEALEPLEIGVKIGGSIINNLRFADDIDLIAETEKKT